MQPEFSFDWESVRVSANELLARLRKSRHELFSVFFQYGGGVYHIGVNPENTCEPFFMEDETYPSLLALTSSACIEGGFLLTDLGDRLEILVVNGADPANFFESGNAYGT